MMKRNCLSLKCLLGAILVLSPAASPAGAQEAKVGSLEAAVNELANDIVNYLQEEKANELRLGNFLAPPEVNSERAGNAIEDSLATRLKKSGVTVETEGRASLELRGELFFEEESLFIFCEIRNGRRVRKTFEKTARDVGEIAQVLGLTGKLATDDVEQRIEDVVQAFDAPAVDIEAEVNAVTGDVSASRISSRPDSKFGVEICVKNAAGAYESVPAENKAGQALVRLKLDSIYGVRLFNDSPHRVAVTLTVDGLNMFRFSEVNAFREFGRLIVPPNTDKPGRDLIKGWHKTNKQCFEFQVSKLEDVVKARGNEPQVVESNRDIGVITASFAVAVAPGEELPEDEQIVDRNVGTVPGKVIPANFGATQIGKIGKVREVVSVRYTSNTAGVAALGR